ncbi:transcription elongation factor GreA [Weissella koreensis]|uniref:Transcription elongation factor GreA n=1 Tax=Weissella koreensis TaxID=165096 RepID=A0A7H1MME9_9LACO|nr:transcription elongation factor GreA [Weissella koreensis]AEJ23805.1 transcription elongation factor GreA [Weissella koreensis KACC 15510]AVH75432.1 transcription elongation factor GreA [Weissella koreensis]EJF34410.1 elongation factor GreA [Weissella koreensis KCTC 3621]MCZ9311276.1 transcription elongation factor GreA [Weissella koreensis]QGN20656.1 transcription elongation factor GreA [Weissella koreensis]
MADEKTYPMTLEGKQKLEAELNELITVRRGEVTAAIQEARSHGDLSENSEYQSAKDEQAFMEGQIKSLQNMLDNSEVIDSSSIAADEVSVGKTVTFQEDGDEPESYTIVGSIEADPDDGKISNESPIGKALIGHKVGDMVKITTENGFSFEVKIISVTLA